MGKRVRGRAGEASPFVVLRSHASRRSEASAFTVLQDDRRVTHTWSELFATVEAAAAGFLHSGLRSGQVALLAMGAGEPAFVVERALRTIGVVPLWVPPGLRADASSHIVQTVQAAAVALVVVEEAPESDVLASLAPASARLLVTGDPDSWDGLIDLGRARLRQDPDAVVLTEQSVRADATSPRFLTPDWRILGRAVSAGPDGEDEPVLFTPRDTVLVAGEPHDPFTAHILDAAVSTGAHLGWVGRADALATAMASVRPVVLAGSSTIADEVDRLLDSAVVGGRVWHDSPALVLEAVEAVSTSGRPPRGARRRASSIGGLRPWFGGSLHHVVLGTEPSPRLRSVLEALAIDLDVARDGALEVATLPAPAEVVTGDPTSLPRRTRGQVETAFTLAAPPLPPSRLDPMPHRVETAHLDSSASTNTDAVGAVGDAASAAPAAPAASVFMPLLGGESALDRVLAHQATTAPPVPEPPEAAELAPERVSAAETVAAV